MREIQTKARRQGRMSTGDQVKIEIIRIEISKLRHKAKIVKRKVERQEKVNTLNQDEREENEI